MITTGEVPPAPPAERYGGSSTAAVAFVLLMIFAAYVLIDSRHLMSNACFDQTGQIVCPISGPDWARPVPGAATLLGLLAGLAGLAIGRPVRTAAMVAGFVLMAGALVGAWLIG